MLGVCSPSPRPVCITCYTASAVQSNTEKPGLDHCSADVSWLCFHKEWDLLSFHIDLSLRFMSACCNGGAVSLCPHLHLPLASTLPLTTDTDLLLIQFVWIRLLQLGIQEVHKLHCHCCHHLVASICHLLAYFVIPIVCKVYFWSWGKNRWAYAPAMKLICWHCY